MFAITVSSLAVGSSRARPSTRSATNLNYLRSVLLKPQPKHFNGCSNALNFFFKPPQASTASGSTDISAEGSSTITFLNDDAADSTLFIIQARNRIGLLQVITRVFKVLGLTIERATVEFEADFFIKKFYVTSSEGKKIENLENLERIKKALMEAIDAGGDAVGGHVQVGGRVVVKKSVSGLETLGERRAKAEKMFGMMDGFLKNDPMSLQKDILHHVEYTVPRSRFSFDDFEAYQVIFFGSKS